MPGEPKTVATRVVSGPGELANLGKHVRELGGQRVLLLCGPSRRHVAEATAALGELPVTVFDDARVHVPAEVVESAAAALKKSKADVVVSLGGGASTGLAKALRLEHDILYVAVPTTYAGSEMTRIWGITEQASKRTGRDDRVRPRLVVLDPDLTRGMPRALTVQSLLNALAHPVSALARAPAASDNWEPALAAVRRLVRATLMLAAKPDHSEARWLAMKGAAAAGRVLDDSELGAHHKVAHVLGGRFGAPHAALHSVLLPSFLAWLREHQPARFEAIARAGGEADLVGNLHDALLISGAPTGLRALELNWEEVSAALAEADLDGDQIGWVHNAFLGRRQAAFTRQESWLDGQPPLTLAGPPLAEADKVILALHGRGTTADQITARVCEVVGDAPDVAIVAPQAAAARWYDTSYRDATGTAPLQSALDTVATVLAKIREEIDNDRIVLFGFSQGACLALEAAARLDAPVDSVIALSGLRVGKAELPTASSHLTGVDVLLGLSEGDPWVDAGDLDRTAANLTAAGAEVRRLDTTGDAHEITARQRLAARALICGVPQEKSGFGNHFQMETLPGALPHQQNSPRRVAHGLLAEQINGTGFAAPRASNHRSWLYRVRVPAGHRPFSPLEHPTMTSSFIGRGAEPELAAIGPLPIPEAPTDFVDGLHTVGGAGDPGLRRGYAVHVYAANRSMENRALYNADGDFLLLPQQGVLTLLTELGALTIAPGELATVPRGIRFSVLLHEAGARGYLAETFGRHFELPERGIVGANGLADPRHFRAPQPYHENRIAPGFRVVAKLGGRLWEHDQDHSPFDVAAWHGDYTPMAYDISLFSPVANVRFDHGDPSVYTVLSAPLDEPGSNGLDLVCFPPRWDATLHTFRPPFSHRNATMEINGIINNGGVGSGAFTPGMCFMTPPMTAHAVVAGSLDHALSLSDEVADKPRQMGVNQLWFQFESALPMAYTDWARDSEHRIAQWHEIWGVYKSYYRPS